MPSLRDQVVDAVEILDDRAAAFGVAMHVIAASRGLAYPGLVAPPSLRAADALPGWRSPDAADDLGAVYESLLPGRKASGSFYTPPGLVEWVLSEALDPALESVPLPTVVDPACGTGHFLLPAARRIATTSGAPLADVLTDCVHGVDLDPVAVEITRFLLWLSASSVSWSTLEAHVRVGDALRVDWPGEYDVVVGNPPFLNQLRSETVRASTGVGSSGAGAYTDTSALFLSRALDLVRPGGRVSMVQPLSVLGVRDAAPVRASVARAGALTALWSSVTPVFADTSVLTCAPVIRRGAAQGPVATWHGPAYARGDDVPATTDQLLGEWGFVIAPGLGIPAVSLSTDAGVLGDLGTCTADFRDEYYGLVPFVREAVDAVAGSGEAPLVTTGLIDPAECRWGRVTTRFAKHRYAAPVVDLVALRASGGLARWAAARLVPKVLVATQGRVIEAVVDEHGEWLPSVPTLTFTTTSPDRLWHVLAVLLAPPVVAHAAARFVGTGLSVTAVKLSAKQLAALPLPGDPAAWDRGARLAREAQLAPSDEERASLLRACAATMCAAYDSGDPDVLEWWMRRAWPAHVGPHAQEDPRA